MLPTNLLLWPMDLSSSFEACNNISTPDLFVVVPVGAAVGVVVVGHG